MTSWGLGMGGKISLTSPSWTGHWDLSDFTIVDRSLGHFWASDDRNEMARGPGEADSVNAEQSQVARRQEPSGGRPVGGQSSGEVCSSQQPLPGSWAGGQCPELSSTDAGKRSQPVII